MEAVADNVTANVTENVAEKWVKIPINQLKPEMFVVKLDQGSHLFLRHAGVIKSPKVIQDLAKIGIRHVWIDLARSKLSLQSQHLPELVPNEYVEHQKDINQAKNLMKESRRLMTNILYDVHQNHLKTAALVTAQAKNLIRSLERNQDALYLASAIRHKDKYLLEHSVNVAVLLINFGRYLGMKSDELEALAIGGMLHDIGKLQVDQKVLNKPGKLNKKEFEKIKAHQTFAESTLAQLQYLPKISQDVCLQHHEKLDGSGYPKGLSAQKISIYGRMASICDVYDAITAERCYKPRQTALEAVKILISMTPNQLDRKLVHEFVCCMGVYPAGSIVELDNGLLGIVWQANLENPRRPIVKCFYSMMSKEILPVEYVDLRETSVGVAKTHARHTIPIDPNPYF